MWIGKEEGSIIHRQLDIKHALYIGTYVSSNNVDDRGTYICDNI